MEVLVPIGVLILSFFLGIIFFKQALSEKKIKPFKLVYVGTFIIFYLLILIVFYEDIKEDSFLTKLFNYIYFGSYIILGLSFLFNTSNNVSKKFLYSEYYKCIENERLYVLIDKNDRIKEISSLFEEALKDSDKSIIGEYFSSVFDDKFTLAEINEQDFNNVDLKRIFNDLKNETKSKVIPRELKVYDRKTNKPFVIKFNDHIIVENGKYRGHILIGDSRTGDDVLKVESDLKSNQSSLESIKLRFTTHLEMTEEAIFFYNLDDSSIWASDAFVRNLHLNGNSFKRSVFTNLIHPDDLPYYNQIMSEINSSNPKYDIKYRFKTGANYSYVREYGKRLYGGSTNEIMGYIQLLDTNHYERSNIAELDNVKSSEDLMTEIDKLYQIGRAFELVTFRINNIDDINEKYGRQMGNLVMAEYLKAMWKSFVEEDRIYRSSGLEFTFIITDYRKMDLLKQALMKDKLLKVAMQYGSIKLETDVYMGIADSTDVRLKSDLYKATKQALKTALMDQVRTNYIYYKDIR